MTTTNGAAYGAVELLSKLTFVGAFLVTVDVAGLDTGLGSVAESGLGIKASGCCSPATNFRYADIFGYGNAQTRANDYIGVTLTRAAIAGGDRLAIAGNTGGEQFHFNLFLDQSFGAADDNRVGFSNVVLTADTINGAVPEPATWGLMLAGFALTGAAMRWRVPATA